MTDTDVDAFLADKESELATLRARIDILKHQNDTLAEMLVVERRHREADHAALQRVHTMAQRALALIGAHPWPAGQDHWEGCLDTHAACLANAIVEAIAAAPAMPAGDTGGAQ